MQIQCNNYIEIVDERKLIFVGKKGESFFSAVSAISLSFAKDLYETYFIKGVSELETTPISLGEYQDKEQDLGSWKEHFGM